MRLLSTALLLLAASPGFAQSAAPVQNPLQLPPPIPLWHGQNPGPDLRVFPPSIPPYPQVQLSANPVCFTLRIYHFTRIHPESDVTRLTGYTTCQTGGLFQRQELEHRK